MNSGSTGSKKKTVWTRGKRPKEWEFFSCQTLSRSTAPLRLLIATRLKSQRGKVSVRTKGSASVLLQVLSLPVG